MWPSRIATPITSLRFVLGRATLPEFTWGFVAGDFDANGMTDIAAYRDLDGQWLRLPSTGSGFSNDFPWKTWDSFTRTEFFFGGDFRESGLS